MRSLTTKVLKMDGQTKRFVRFRADLDSNDGYNSDSNVPLNQSNQKFTVNARGSSGGRGWEKGSLGIFRLGNSLKFKSYFQAYDESDPKPGKKTYLDPASQSLHRWNTFFVFSCLVAIFVDPLFYYLPYVNNEQNCIGISVGLKKSVTVFRTITDFLYMIHMFLQFKTAYIAPSSRVFGRGDLVTDPKKIAIRYLRKDFWLDLLAVLPIPQLNAVTRHEESSSIYCIPPVPSSPISSLSIDVQDHQHNWGVHGNGLGWSRFQPPPLHACEPCCGRLLVHAGG